jgi:hypothetical protein
MGSGVGGRTGEPEGGPHLAAARPTEPACPLQVPRLVSCRPNAARPPVSPRGIFERIQGLGDQAPLLLELRHCPSTERIVMTRHHVLVLAALAAFSTAALAVDGGAVLGGAIGGGAGAAVGSAVGGRDGAIIGGAIGGAAGAAIGSSGSKETKAVTREVVVEKEVVYVPTRHDNGLHRGHFKHKHGHHKD